MTVNTTEMTPEQHREARDAAVRKGYQEASKTLRENHREEFVALQKAAIEALGFEWSPAPTKTQKAEAELKALLADNPELRERLIEEIKQA